MSEAIIVAVLSLIGTLIGSALSSNRIKALIEYRVGELEKKVDKHNQMIERTYKLEGRMDEVEHDIRDIKSKL